MTDDKSKTLKFTSSANPATGEISVTGTLLDHFSGPAAIAHIADEIAHELARRYVIVHFQELVAKIDPHAIVNLAVMQAGRRIGDTLAGNR